jgi:hypothetical protein
MTRRTLLALAFALVAFGSVAEAQEQMALRFYVVPKVVDPGLGANVPKYIFAMNLPFRAMDYGLEDTFLVGAQVTNTQHTALAANIDVITIPAGLDNQISLTALSQVQARLEGINVPADWVTTNHTYRDVIRITGKLFLYMQRFHAQQLRKFFLSGVTLDTQVKQLTSTQRTAMTDAATSLNLDVSVINGNMTLRQALRLIIQQLPSFELFGETF